VELGNHLNWNHPSVVEMSISAPGASMWHFGSDCTDQLQSGQLYVGPFQLHQFDIGGKGPIQMIRIQGFRDGRQPENCGDIQDLTPQFYWRVE
jgi:hypothetical protein